MQTMVFRNWDIPSLSLPMGTWEVINGTIQNTYNGGTYTAVTVKSTGGLDLTARYTYMELGTGEMITLEWTTLVRAVLTPGTVMTPTAPVAVPLEAMTPPIELSGPTGGVDGGTFSWEKSVTAGVWVPMGYGMPHLPPQLMEGAVQYRRAYTCNYDYVTTHNVPAETVYSAAVQFTSLPAVQGGTLSPATQTVQLNANAAIAATAGSGGSCGTSVAYQWQQSFDNVQFFDIPGATSTAYTPLEMKFQTYFRRRTTCGIYTVFSNVAKVDIAEYASSNPVNENYTRVFELKKRGLATFAQAMSASATDKFETTQYFDGLGRKIQTVQRGLSAAGKDVVSPDVYDNAGRQALSYSPYPATVSDGKYKAGQVAAFNTFMGAQFPGESHFHSRSQFEESPGGPVEKIFAPGASWGGSNRGVDARSGGNTLAEGIRIWKVTGSYASVPVSSSSYGDGELAKEISVNENGKAVQTFKDKEGRLILRKVQVDDSPSAGYDGWLCTYYVYDDLSQLRYILPPRATDILKTNGWSLTDSTIINGFCFRYEYDGKERMVYKKVPGAEAVEMVYDIRDRLVFMRDGNQRNSGKWLVTFFDDQNRPVQTALYTSSATRGALQAQMNAITGTTTVTSNIPGPNELIVPERAAGITRYVATGSIVLTAGFESGANDEFVAEIDPALSPVVVSIQANNPLPGISPSQLYPLTYTYYDRYDAAAQPFIAAYLDSLESGTSTTAELPTAASKQTRSLVTSIKTRILDTDNWIFTTNYYDAKGRLLQVISNNLAGGADVLTNRYDFKGNALSTYIRQQNPLSQDPVITTLTVNKYDYGNRLVSVDKEINGSYRRTIATNEYNELGQLKKKTLGNNLETLEYEYNIRGWIKGINKSFAQTGGSHYFGTSLHYNDGLTTPQYNGDISAITWRSAGDLAWRSYDFTYDASSRLKGADFKENSGGSWAKNPNVDFSVSSLAYDANGNISSMTQKGMKNGTSSTIDQLTYTYNTNSNQLKKVADAANDPASQLGDFKDLDVSNTTDYLYDRNGNLTYDNNKGIQSISYNNMNLPSRVHIMGKGTISYLYTATGVKYRKIVVDSTYSPAKKIVTDYFSNAVFENDTLKFVGHEEGRLRPVVRTGQPRTFEYDYFVKDHLGNIRVVLTEQVNFATYAATMETERAPVENALFSNIDNTRAEKPSGYPADNSAGNSTQVSRLNATNADRKIGPSLVLKVMAGDTVAIGAKAFYKSVGQPVNKKQLPLTDMATALVNAFSNSGRSSGVKVSGDAENSTPFNQKFLNEDYERLKEKDPESGGLSDRPKAYLNFVLFDDQFNLVDENSGAKQVKAEPDQLQVLAQGKMVMQKNGFLYVYTSNETQQDVYFDNVVVEFSSGPILEETHYYPFGLTMAGISNTSLQPDCGCPNQKKFNGNELQTLEFGDGSGLELYDFNARTYGQQIGRFIQIDPKLEDGGQESMSPYQYAGNNPVRFNDPDGNCPWCWGAVIGGVLGGGIELAGQLMSGKSLDEVDWADVAVETGKGALEGAMGGGALAKSGTIVNKLLRKGVVEVVGEVTKATVDISVKDGVQTTFTGEKTLASASVDLVLGLGMGKLNGALADGVAKGTSNLVKKAEKKIATTATAVEQASKKLDKIVNKTGGYGVGATVAKVKLESALATNQQAYMQRAVRLIWSQTMPNTFRTGGEALENVTGEFLKKAYRTDEQ